MINFKQNENKQIIIIGVLVFVALAFLLASIIKTASNNEDHNLLFISCCITFFILTCVTFYALIEKNREMQTNLKLKQAFETIKEQESMQRLIIESTQNGYILFDIDRKITLTNNTFFEMFNLDEEAKKITSGSEMRELLSLQMKNPDYFIEGTINLFNTLKIEKESYELKDGRILERLSMPLFQNNIQIGRLCNFRDITARRRLEEREKHRLKLELELALKHSKLGLWYWEIKNNRFEYSESLAEMLGYSLKEFEGAEISREKLIFEHDKSRVLEVLDKCLKGESRYFEAQYRTKTKSGELKWVLDQGEIIHKDENGFPLVMTGTYTDITEQKKLQELLQQNEKMISIGELAAGMAHEINNPLGGIILGCHNFLRRVNPDFEKNREIAAECSVSLEDLYAYLQKRGLLKIIHDIKGLGERASVIISDMLSFSRKSGSAKEKASAVELLEKALELVSSDFNLQKNFDFRNIKISREYMENPPSIECKRVEIEQVFLNLIKNAAQSMPKEVENPEIRLKCFQTGDFLRIEIEDNGSGMTENIKRRIFEPFFTTKEPGIGTGLGLSVSYFIIKDSHKGNISVESELGRGTKFTIDLPIVIKY